MLTTQISSMKDNQQENINQITEERKISKSTLKGPSLLNSAPALTELSKPLKLPIL